MQKVKQPVNSNQFCSFFQVKDDQLMTYYLKALYKDILTEGRITKVTFCQYLGIPYFLCTRIFNRYGREETPYIQEDDFYDFIKSIYLCGYADIVEVVYQFLDPYGNEAVRSNEVKILLRHLVGSKDTKSSERIENLVGEIFTDEDCALSLFDFKRLTEYTSSGLFLVIFNYFVERKPFTDETFKCFSKLSLEKMLPVKSTFSRSSHDESQFAYPSGLAISFLNLSLKRRLAKNPEESTDVTYCIFESSPSEMAEGDSDEYAIDEDAQSANELPTSLKLKNSFDRRASFLSDLPKIYIISPEGTSSDCIALRKPININYLNNDQRFCENKTRRLHEDNGKPMERRQSSASCGTNSTGLSLLNSKFFSSSKVEVELSSLEFSFENYIYKFNKKRGKFQKFWIAVFKKDVFYFKDSTKEKLKGFHNLTDSFVINESPLIDETKNNKVYYFKLQMRNQTKKFFFTSYTECESTMEAYRKILKQKDINDFFKLSDLDREQLDKVKISKAVNKSTGETVIIKTLHKDNKLKTKFMMNELDITTYCNHANIVNIHGVFEDAKRIYLVLEHLNQDSLSTFLIQKGNLLTKSQALDILSQVTLAIKYLHSNGIVHRDIKPDNIGISDNNGKLVAKLLDFGLSDVTISSTEVLTEPCGTIYFCAPEIMKRKYNLSVDIWSLGVVMCYLFYGKIPFKIAKDVNDFKKRLENMDIELFLSDYECEFSKSLIRKCLVRKAKKRATIFQIFEFLDQTCRELMKQFC
jgi:myosin-light-chain kinase